MYIPIEGGKDDGPGFGRDIRLIEIKNFQAQEAALTGESTAVEKSPDAVAEEAELNALVMGESSIR